MHEQETATVTPVAEVVDLVDDNDSLSNKHGRRQLTTDVTELKNMHRRDQQTKSKLQRKIAVLLQEKETAARSEILKADTSTITVNKIIKGSWPFSR